MTQKRTASWAASFLLALLLFAPGCGLGDREDAAGRDSLNEPDPSSAVSKDGAASFGEAAEFTLSAEDARLIYDYAYPLVIMKLSQDVMFTVPFRPPSFPNRFIHFKRLAQPQNRAVVLGNRNTLYSVGWIDLSTGPVVFQIPDMGDRYYVMPLLDAWTNTFRSLGSRTTGQAAQRYLLVPPDWRGAPPADHEVIVCPTSMVWITGRIQADDPQDALAAGLLQDQYRLESLSRYAGGEDVDSAYAPDHVAAVVKRPVPYSLQMSAEQFYNTFFSMWAANASPERDLAMVQLLASAGIERGVTKRFEDLPATVRFALADGLLQKQKDYLAAFYNGEEQRNAWIFNRERMGTWGTDYSRRAYWAMWGLGANLVEDAVYGVSQLDATLQPLDGGSRYRLHFDADQLPPTSAFWSVTAYDREGYLEANDLDRYSLGSNHSLNYNADGSVDIYLAHKRPANEDYNWVPAPRGRFKVLFRIYWPTDSVLSGEWDIPPLHKVSDR